MPCKIFIREAIEKDVREKTDGGFNLSLQGAKELAREINSEYGVNVVEFVLEADMVSRRIDVPQSLVDEYYDSELEIENLEASMNPDTFDDDSTKGMTDDEIQQLEDARRAGREDSDYLFFQQESESNPQSSESLIKKVKEVLKRLGVDIRSLEKYARESNLNLSGVNAVADLARGILAIADGKENEAITEEMVHIATAMIEQVNPVLINEMISKIGRFKIYKQTLEEYKGNKNYQTKDGKPDIRKIKKEAVDKLIAALIVRNEDGTTEGFSELLEEENRSWVRRMWQKIVDFFSGRLKENNISIFEDAAKQVMSIETAPVGFSQLEDEVYFNYSEEQKSVQAKILKTQEYLKKEYSEETPDPILMGEDEATNWYMVKDTLGNWRRVTKRVTDRVKQWYKQTFKGKVFDESEKIYNEFKRVHGVKYHEYFEDIHHRYFDEKGVKRSKALARPAFDNAIDTQIYTQLEKYFVKLVDSHSKDGNIPLVLSEVMIYDPVLDEAGTIDLMIIDADGTVHVYDWKFMVIGSQSKDVAWYKKNAYNTQLTRYRDILIDNYGVRKIGKNRAVPIAMNVRFRNPKDFNSEKYIRSVTIGSLDPKDEVPLNLTPVSQEDESTGHPELDQVIKTLNATYKLIQRKEVASDEEKEYKRERLQIIERAARIAQANQNIAPLIDVVSVLKREGENLINEYLATYKGKNPRSKEFSNKQLSQFSQDLREFMTVAEHLSRVDDQIAPLIYNKKMEEAAKTTKEKQVIDLRKKILARIQEEARQIRNNRTEVMKIATEFADKFTGERNLVAGLLDPEVVIKGLGAKFRGMSELGNKALSILYKVVSSAQQNATREALQKVKRLEEIHQKIKEGGNVRERLKQIYKPSKDGAFMNRSIQKYSKDFYEGIENNSLEGNRSRQYLRDSINISEYAKEALDYLKKREKYINNIYADNESLRDELIEQERRKFDITRADFNGWKNFILYKHPKDKWLSKEYLDLKKNDPAVFELFEFISEINTEAKEIGYLKNQAVSSFLPFIRKNMAESLAWDGGISGIKNFADNFQIKADDVGFGNINELTGQVENSIPRYYTYDFTREEGTEQVSQELIRNMILYTQHLYKYKHLSEVEDQLKLVRTITEFKKHIETNKLGQVAMEGGYPRASTGNADNLRLLDEFMKVMVYDQRYPQSDTDTAVPINQVLSGVKKLVNRVAGKEVFSDTETPDPLSLIKTIDAANRAFQIKALGFEFISGAANIFGGNIQVATQAGNYFTSSEFFKNEFKLIADKLGSAEEKEMFRQLLETFMPLKESPLYQKMLNSGLTMVTRQSFSDILMTFMRVPELHLEASIFKTLLDNMMVIDGKIVSIREHVKSKYPNRTTQSPARYRETKEAIKREIEDLKRTKSITATKKLVNGKLEIPGLDLNNWDELNRLTQLSRTIARNATGSFDDAEINQANMSIWFRSMMVFKNWIPKLLDTRFTEFRKVADDFSVEIDEDGMTTGEKYEIGRVRLFFLALGKTIVEKEFSIKNILQMNEKGIESLDQLYKEFADSYYKRTGKVLNMDRDQFNELILNNLRNQIREFIALGMMVGTSLSLGALAPDDDDKANRADRNRHRFYQRVIDKFVDELSFFYNPFEFQRMVSGSAFPAIGIITDFTRFVEHLIMETTGVDIRNTDLTPEEVRKKAQPIKNAAKMFPVTKSIVTYAAIIDPEFAKEYDVTIPKNNVRR